MVKLTCLASCTAVALLLFVTEPAFAEFQIQEAGIEKGEVELEYRGAYHWGVPQVTDTNENANDLVQSHEFELQMGVTDWWLLSVTTGLDQPLGETCKASAVEVETEFALLKRQGDGIALSFQTGYEQAFNHGAQVDGDPNQFGFGPIVELAKGPLLVDPQSAIHQADRDVRRPGRARLRIWLARRIRLHQALGCWRGNVRRDRGFGERRSVQPPGS